VAALAAENDLPEPTIDIDSLPPSFSNLLTPGQEFAVKPNGTLPVYSADDPWSTTARSPPVTRPANVPDFGGAVFSEAPAEANVSSTGIAGTGLPEDWWKNLEIVNINIKGQQGFILNRYTVYDVTSLVSPAYTSIH
jgi:sorting nexin-8